MNTRTARRIGVALFCLASGLAPLPGRAATRTPRADITIVWDGQFDRAHGVRSGNGTPSSPYVISGWSVGNITLKDTDKAVRVTDNTVTGTITLNWIGKDVLVDHNDAQDLRVNENVARWGDGTAGRIEHNTFTRVSELRHYDGRFSSNTVGAPQTGMFGESYPDTRAVNFDGFNNAHFDHNTIYGYVDARLHGHQHSSAFGMPSHSHAGGPHEYEMMPVDHTHRYDEVFIAYNSIFTSADYALAYLDTNHSANDLTANSETNPYLNAPHTHYTRIHLTSNRLFGAGILVDVFNAVDEHHAGYGWGAVDLVSNSVTLTRELPSKRKALNAIEVRRARFVTVHIDSNAITGPAPLVDVLPQLADATRLDGSTTGILLNTIEAATIWIGKDRISNRHIGVHALSMTKSVRWTIWGLKTDGVTQPVMYDSTVKNAPARR